jgi:hemoglobin-like flavoprotein
MALDVEEIRASFAAVAAREPLLARRFYACLLARQPALAGLLTGGAAEREQALTGTIANLVEHAGDPAWLEQELGAIGARHLDLGIGEPFYAAASDCLLAALAEAAGPVWRDRSAVAWANACGVARDLLLLGAHAAAPTLNEVRP